MTKYRKPFKNDLKQPSNEQIAKEAANSEILKFTLNLLAITNDLSKENRQILLNMAQYLQKKERI
jgi:hypothetical protein